MANINLYMEDALKKNFKVKSVEHQMTMSTLLRDFMEKFIYSPEQVKKFLYG